MCSMKLCGRERETASTCVLRIINARSKLVAAGTHFTADRGRTASATAAPHHSRQELRSSMISCSTTLRCYTLVHHAWSWTSSPRFLLLWDNSLSLSSDIAVQVCTVHLTPLGSSVIALVNLVVGDGSTEFHAMLRAILNCRPDSWSSRAGLLGALRAFHWQVTRDDNLDWMQVADTLTGQ